MGNTTYDWAPFFQAINNATTQWGQRNQVNSMIDGLSGSAPAPNSATLPMPMGGTTQLNGAMPTLPGQSATPGPLNGMNPQILQMLRNAPPSVAMPLLLQLGTKNADREQSIADKKITPMTDIEAKAAGLRPGGVYGRDISGNIVAIQDSDLKSPAAIQQGYDVTAHTPVSPWQQAKLENDAAGRKIQQGQLSESVRHNMADEEAKLHPFGINADTTKTGDAFLKSMNPAIASQIKAIASYRQAPPANRATPAGIALMSAVNQYNPSYDASQYGAKVKARNDFTTGKNGNNVRSLNVAVQHLEQLNGLATSLGNGDVQQFNKLSQFIAQQTGSAAPTNFDGVKQMVGDEIVKAVVGSGGGVHDREEIANNISRASSPQQLMGVIKQYQGLLGGQLRGLRKQYEQSTGLNDFESYLDPLTVTKLQGGDAVGGGVTKTIGGDTYIQRAGKWYKQ